MAELALGLLLVAILSIEVFRWLSRRPAAPDALVRAADKAFQRGDLDKAAESYREALRLTGAHPGIYYKLSAVAFQQGDYETAIEHLRQCLRWAPDVAEAEHNLGAAYYHMGNYDASLEHYHRALELAPEDQQTRENLAALYHELDRAEEAKEVCADFVPPTPEERERIERVQKQLEGQGEQALRRWEKTARAAVWAWRVARVGVAAWIVWEIAAVVYGYMHPGTAPEPPPTFALIAGVSLAVVWGAVLLLRAMETWRGRYVRRVMRGVGVSNEDIEALSPVERGVPWWRVELSGLHLALWLGIPFVVLAFGRDSDPPGWMAFIAVYTVLAWIFKGGFWMGLLLVEPERRPAWRARYRWFGTLKGTLFGLVAVPGIVAAFCLLLALGLELAGA